MLEDQGPWLPQGQSGERNCVSFGPFRLFPTARLLQRSGISAKIGGRALDILIALVNRAGEVISSDELTRVVWPTTTVVEANLRMQMSALRRALGSESATYISNVSGRGYCFTAPVSWSLGGEHAGAEPRSVSRRSSLPLRPRRTVGRQEMVREVVRTLTASRFVTIAGSAGIGKTTIAILASYDLLDDFDDEIYFIDLGYLEDAELIDTALLNALGLSVSRTDLLPRLASFTQGRPLLLVFDNCEHLIDDVAVLVEALHKTIQSISILATSREPLRAEGEHVVRPEPLKYPPLSERLPADEAMAFPAIELFVDRVSATSNGFALSDEDAPAAADICARLDGIPLALEIAAGRVGAFGVRGTAALMSNTFGLIWQGRRTAPARQRTLAAALDWSYGLLSHFECRIFESLSIFVGIFTLEAAEAVISANLSGHGEVADAIEGLVSKSMISSVSNTPFARFRLLQTTRAYARERLTERGDLNEVAKLHAAYFIRLLHRLNADSSLLPIGDAFWVYGDHIGNVRAALEWSYSGDGDQETSATLSAQAGPLFIELSLLTECLSWMERAVKRLPTLQPDAEREMRVNSALGVSRMFTSGGDEARKALERALELALEIGDATHALGLCGMLNIYFQRVRNYDAAMEVARRGERMALAGNDQIAIMMSKWLLGISHHLIGDHLQAHMHLESALLSRTTLGLVGAVSFLGYDHRVRALGLETVSLWLRGYQDRALRAARIAVEDAERVDQPIPISVACISAICLLLWAGDLIAADDRIDQVIDHAEKYSLASFRAAALGLRGDLLVQKGQGELGVLLLQENLEVLNRGNYFVLSVGLTARLAEGFAALGRFVEARETIEALMIECASRDDVFDIADLLRVRAEIAMATPCPDLFAAEQDLLSAIDWARRQSALSWELRATTTLAGLWRKTGRVRKARRLLEDIYGQFIEGFANSDLRKAGHMLDLLAEPP